MASELANLDIKRARALDRIRHQKLRAERAYNKRMLFLSRQGHQNLFFSRYRFATFSAASFSPGWREFALEFALGVQR
ncbi:hypothetical protein CRG98_029888 [Punica granatum]|uniref:Uncharacterized protein n=1 Tax=Punica granatum TaxID=22663 RepID=A0A2I0J1E8_PUNGR|nr:hypothetical protein CRG98_029888 [Punica granatum]